MKSIILRIFCAAFPLFLVSCDSWLETKSSTEVDADELFKTEEGFYDALIGVYLTMGDENAYGKQYTWFGVDLAGYPYVAMSTNAYSIWQEHRYTTTLFMTQMEYLWTQGYNIIANINNILTYLETHGSVLPEISRDLINGELLGLRAMVHFDLLRMYGLSSWNGENASKLTIPYVTVYSKDLTPQRTYADIFELLKNDIENALVYLEKDPAKGAISDQELALINSDGLWTNRQKRMNYYAVKALAARVYLWEGSDQSLETAYRHASEVIDGGLARWVDLSQFYSGVANDYLDWTFTTEALFSLEVYGLSSLITGYLTDVSSFSHSVALSSNLVENYLFANDGMDDVRYNALLGLSTGSSGQWYSKKLHQYDNYLAEYKNRVPLIKLSEMYYIAAEYHIRKGDNATALSYLNTVRQARGRIGDYSASVDADEELTLEYMREFINEGQFFYYLKRRGIEEPLSGYVYTVTADDLIFPYPLSETSMFNRVQEK